MFQFKNEDIARASLIVNQLNLPEEFGNDDNETEIVKIEDQLDKILEENYCVKGGISKLVIDIEDLPFVIKIPFNGRWEYDFDSEDDEPYFISFTEAGPYNFSDYCLVELERTERVIDNGYEDFVPNMMYLCDVCGYCIYIQEKVIPISEGRKKLHPSMDSLEKAKNYELSFSDDWIATVIDLYGEDKWNEFVQWVTVTDIGIFSDMHSGNYGISMAGRPVMLDISGFRD